MAEDIGTSITGRRWKIPSTNAANGMVHLNMGVSLTSSRISFEPRAVRDGRLSVTVQVLSVVGEISSAAPADGGILWDAEQTAY